MLIFQETAGPAFHDMIKKIYNLSFYTLGDSAAAEQLTQKAFAAASRVLPGNSDHASFEKHCCKSIYRQIKRRKIPGDGYMTGRNENERGAAQKTLTKALSTLNHEDRFIILLCILCRYPVGRVSEIISLPPVLSKKRILRSLNTASLQIENTALDSMLSS